MTRKRKNNIERINDMDKKIEQIKAQKQTLISREKEKERKKRTKRLITIGAIMAHIGIDTQEKANCIQAAYNNNPQFCTYIQKLVSNSD